MRAQGPQVRVMGARPLGRAIWQRLPRQAWALQCVLRLEKSFQLSLHPTHQSHKGTSRQGSAWWSPKVAGPAETGASEGRGARGAAWGCFTTGVRRAGASAGAHRDGVRCTVLPGRPPPDRQAGGQTANTPHFWQLKGPVGTVAALFCRSHRLCIPGPQRGWGWIPAGHGGAGAAG